MDGWESWQRQTDDGAIESEQRVLLVKPVVEFSAAGAERLGRTYWRDLVRSTIRGFLPSLAARQGERDWTGALYSQVQNRRHVAISRRYFARLVDEARR
jgi:hypothetical protein